LATTYFCNLPTADKPKARLQQNQVYLVRINPKLASWPKFDASRKLNQPNQMVF